jgi:hypothetical protein
LGQELVAWVVAIWRITIMKKMLSLTWIILRYRLRNLRYRNTQNQAIIPRYRDVGSMAVG